MAPALMTIGWHSSKENEDTFVVGDMEGRGILSHYVPDGVLIVHQLGGSDHIWPYGPQEVRDFLDRALRKVGALSWSQGL